MSAADERYVTPEPFEGAVRETHRGELQALATPAANLLAGLGVVSPPGGWWAGYSTPTTAARWPNTVGGYRKTDERTVSPPRPVGSAVGSL